MGLRWEAEMGRVWYVQGSSRSALSGQAKIERLTMAQAIMDPEQVRRFAEELKRFNSDLQDKVASLQARFAALGDTWQDEEHVKFADEFKQMIKALKKFVEVSNQQSPYLLRKAQRIEEYLNQR
ncbi:MAG TPA: WXG100 family type VII secretion target [Verrucomicrobiae bacterium]|nr:WXG100 family type VII secretion target [Verrucomicrobiae bacterium]